VSTNECSAMPTCRRGNSDWGIDWNPSGTGGAAGLLWMTLSPLMFSVSSWLPGPAV
jgi:hypothetical protein